MNNENTKLPFETTKIMSSIQDTIGFLYFRFCFLQFNHLISIIIYYVFQFGPYYFDFLFFNFDPFI